MSCQLHHSCVCREDLLIESVEALTHIVAGLEKYRETLGCLDKGKLKRTIEAIPSAKSVINRYRQSKTF